MVNGSCEVLIYEFIKAEFGNRPLRHRIVCIGKCKDNLIRGLLSHSVFNVLNEIVPIYWGIKSACIKSDYTI